MNKILAKYGFPMAHPQVWLVAAFAVVLLGSLLGAIAMESVVLAALPLVILTIWVAIVDFKVLLVRELCVIYIIYFSINFSFDK